MVQAEVKKRKSGWFSFSLRGVLLVILVLCVLIGWKMERVRRQRAAVKWAESLQARVAYDDKPVSGSAPSFISSKVSHWLGRDFSDDVVALHFNENHVVSDISRASPLTRLKWLFAYHQPIADITPLAGMTELESLHLANTAVTDLSPLSRMRSLKMLVLDDSNVVDLSPISKTESLAVLSIDRTQVTDLGALANLTNLKELSLNGAKVSNLSQISRLTKLRTLSLNETMVKDLKPLSELTQLETLELHGTTVSDLSPIAALPKIAIFLDLPQARAMMIPKSLKSRVWVCDPVLDGNGRHATIGRLSDIEN